MHFRVQLGTEEAVRNHALVVDFFLCVHDHPSHSVIPFAHRYAGRRRRLITHAQFLRGKTVPPTHHIDDLHQRQAEAQLQRIRFVHHRSLEHIVRVQQMVQQTLLVRPRLADCVCVWGWGEKSKLI